MTLDEAIRLLELRAARRCDGFRVFWSLDDVTAARLVSAFVQQWQGTNPDVCPNCLAPDSVRVAMACDYLPFEWRDLGLDPDSKIRYCHRCHWSDPVTQPKEVAA